MDAFVITITGHDYSERVARRCIESANIPIQTFDAIGPDRSLHILEKEGLKWTWGLGYRGMKHKPYGGNHASRVGCLLSHYLLWKKCARDGPLLILEHDAVFLRPFEEFEFKSICQLNDPRGATPRGDWWSDRMKERGPGVWEKTRVFDDSRPDGLAGNSAYVIKPHAAQKLIELVRDIGAWPNDAIMCRQLLPDLEEIYPFVTRVEPEMSTI